MTEICATVKAVGFHRWMAAPRDVNHLSVVHRHVFTVRVWCWVGHHDRDVEFHQLQRKVYAALFDLYQCPTNAHELQLGSKGCEHVAADVCGHAEVWEDDENGAVIYTDATPPKDTK